MAGRTTGRGTAGTTARSALKPAAISADAKRGNKFFNLLALAAGTNYIF
jgi:hypothetical protein